MQEIDSNQNDSSEKSFFGKLANGDFGLAKTYWLYGVLVGFVTNILIMAISSTGILVVVFLALVAYSVPLYLGVWRAANKYEGRKLWSILAKIATVLGVIMLAGNSMSVVYLIL
jgi:hypothetical protein